MSDDDVTTDAVDSLNASIGIDFTAPEWTQPSPALAVLAMRERAASEVDCDGCNGACPMPYACFATDAAAIRALPTTFTDAELLAAAMQLPEVQALVESAIVSVASYDWGIGADQYEECLPPQFIGCITELRDALAPFMKGGE